MVPFHPRPPWLTGRLQTIRALRWPIPASLPEGHRLWLPLADGDALAAMLHFPQTPRRAAFGGAGAWPLRLGGRPLSARGGAGPAAARLPRAAAEPARQRPEPAAQHQPLPSRPVGGPGAGARRAAGGAGRRGGGDRRLVARRGAGAAAAGRAAETPGLPRILGGAAICPPLQPELAHAAIDANPILGRALLALYRREVLAVPARDLPPELRQAAREARSVAGIRGAGDRAALRLPVLWRVLRGEPPGRGAAADPRADAW